MKYLSSLHINWPFSRSGQVARRGGPALSSALHLVLAGLMIISSLWAGALPVSAGVAPQEAPPGPAVEPQQEGTHSDATSIWSAFQPTLWVTTTTPACSVRVDDSMGLDDGTAGYRFSVDGGGSWSEWSAMGLTVGGEESTTKYLTMTGTTFGQSATANRIQFRIQDTDGEMDTSGDYSVPVDSVAPNPPVGLSAAPLGWSTTSVFTATWTNPSDISGIAGAYYRLDTPPASPTDGTWVAGEGISSLNSFPVVVDGEHTLYLWLKDVAGNVNPAMRTTTTLRRDATAPATPITLTVSPAGWSNSNNFTATWSNPAEVSGIVGVYYKIGSAPAHATDGTYVAQANIAALTGLTVSGNGEFPLYIWLRDAAGNVDHTTRAQATLRYEETLPNPPTSFTSPSHTAGVWSADNTIDVQWAGASDTPSGINGYALVWDQQPTTLPTPITTTAGFSATSPALSDGNSHYAHLRTRDNAGNWTPGALHLGPFFIDSQVPGAPQLLTAQPSSWTSTNQFSLSWSNPAGEGDNVAGAYYKLDSVPAHDTDGTFVAGVGLTSISGLSVSGDGAHAVYVWLKDKAGNVYFANRASTQLYLDSVRPGAPTDLQASPAGWSNTGVYTITWSNPADTSGIAGAYYKLDSEPTSSVDGAWITTTNQITGISVTAEGTHDIYLWLKDRAGNTDYHTRNVLLGAFKYDHTMPATTHQVAGPLGQNGWYTAPVTITLNALDNLSGVAQTRYRLNAGAWQTGTTTTLTASGVYTLEYGSFDGAGNQEGAHALTLSLDREAPATTLLSAGSLGQNSWYTSSVQISLSSVDATAGGVTTYYRLDAGAWLTGTQFLLESDGIHQIDYYAVDQAGNREATKAATVRVDRLTPLTMANTAGTAGDGNWFYSPVTVTLTPTDLASGPAATYYRLDGGAWIQGTSLVVSNESTHKVEYYTRDLAGNAEPIRSLDANIDHTSPLPPFNLAAAPYRTWTNQNTFTITWSSQADLSGIGGAYYKLDGEPANATDGSFASGATNQVSGISVAGEGKHNVYLWLRDGAGNVNHLTRNALTEALWYDASPPTSTHQLSGTLGQNGWYTSSVQVSLLGQDNLAGVDHFAYRLLGQEWGLGSTFVITTSERHTVQYYAVDRAGNSESPRSAFVRVDLDAPAAPQGLRVGPSGWSNANAFSATWTDPLDTSGIGAAYYRLDKPPTSPRDGTLVSSPLGHIDGITVTQEGKHTLYVWLVDNAGNANHTRYASVVDGIWYDSQPPTTTHTISGTLGIGGWYRSPVSLTLSTADAGAGPASTYYRVNGGIWQAGKAIGLSTDDLYTVEYYSTDLAGNSEPPRSLSVKIDTRPPTSRVSAPEGYQSSDMVTIEWDGSDPTPGSDILYYDIEYKEGADGEWVAWRTATDETSGIFVGQRGRTYAFRSRARDRAGNIEAFPTGPGDRQIFIEPVTNGAFETRDLFGWTGAGALSRRVDTLGAHGGGQSYQAVLGNPELGPCYDTQPAVLLEGVATVSQTVYIPTSPDVVVPTLHFWYHIVTYDTVWSERYQRYYDSFDVELAVPGSSTRELLLRDGNYDASKVGAGKPAVDLGWREGEIDLSAYAGKTVTLYFHSYNRVDRYFNTWTYLDDVSVIDSQPAYRALLPQVMRQVTGRLMTDQRLNVWESQGADAPR